jgi:hypothetical protein
MKTLSNVRTHIRSILDDTSQTDWTNTEIDRVINVRYHRVVTAVMNVFEDYYMITDMFNTTAGQEEYGSSDGVAIDIFKIRRVEVNYDTTSSTNSPTRVLPISVGIDAVRRDLGYQNSGIGLHVMSGANYYTYGFGSNFKIGIIPIPDKTATNAGKIWYIPSVSDLSGDNDRINIPYEDRYWILIAEGAAGDLLRFGQQEMDSADKFDIKFEANLAKMMEELEDKISEESKSVMDVTGEYIDFEM